jgi:hypothetical protein
MLLSGMNQPPTNLTVAATGASGAIFLKHFLLTVGRDPRVLTVNFIASDGALRVMAEELGIKGRANLSAGFLASRVAGPRARFRFNRTPTSAPT